MKKALVLLLMLANFSLSYSKKLVSPIAKIDSFTFYGVDYSKCHTYGWDEYADKTLADLASINRLFISEMSKYDLAKFTEKRVVAYDFSNSVRATELANPDSLETTSASYILNKEEIEQAVQKLKLKETQGVGFIVYGCLLNKKENTASYKLVFFDIESRKIKTAWYATGRAGGFGARNYWAKSLYNVLSKMKEYRVKQ